MGAYAPAIADDQQTADVERLHDLIRSALPDLPAHEGGYDLDQDALRARLEEAGRLPVPGAL